MLQQERSKGPCTFMGMEHHEECWGKGGKSADAPLENGCSDSLIRSTNICLKITLLSMLSVDVFLHTGRSIWIFEWLIVNCK